MRTQHLPTALLFPLVAWALQAATPALAPVHLGKLEVWRLQDGQISLPVSLLKGLDAAEARRMLGGKDAVPTPVNAFLVRLVGKTVLVDTGLGRMPDEDSGHLPERLAEAGVKPSDIDLVVITHAHFDHIGGLLNADGSRAFRKATLLVHRLEYAYWTQDPAALPERFRDRVPKLKAAFGAYEKAGAFRTFDDGETLAPGLRALAAHGHTAGHTVFAFGSGKDELWCLGDLLHYGAIQFERPGVGVSFDLEGERAVTIRRELFRQAAKNHVVLAGAHLPGLVRIEAKGEGYVTVPVN
jgi:glyoxylase-like metal-dependent hydrolase (beta-lactamase superfamily II)